MKPPIRRLLVLFAAMTFALLTLLVTGATNFPYSGDDPDFPAFLNAENGAFDKEELMEARAEYIGLKRGVDKDNPADPKLRQTAIATMEEEQNRVASMPASMEKDLLTATWTEIGPNPIPNGQVVSGPQLAVSGRTIAIAVHPTNPNLVYVGTAQGGLYRTTDGGTTWTPLMDNALSLAIGAIAIAPSQPDTIYVGTGEPQFSADSFFGVGIYRIDNASTASPTITGPIGGANFTGRSIGEIVVHPTNANIIFASSTSGIGGIGGTQNNVLADRGLFRSTDALSAAPTFTKLTISGLAEQNRNILDVVMDPGNPNLVLCTEHDSFGLGEGGVYRSTNALAATPTFVRTFVAGVGSDASRTELALHRSGAGVVTVYAASGLNGGTVQRSIDGGATWTKQIDNNFCSPQCFYDIAIEVDPTNAANVYLGGSPTLVFGRSTDSGVTFTNNATTASGLHVDSHTIAVAPSLPSTVYFGSDGGIYKSTDSGTTWATLNNTTFRATQFMSIAVHPIDPNFTIGGTQDNGTNFYQPAATWTRADFGSGGYSVIDQSALNTTTVNMYHTYFNNSTLQGYGFVSTTATATEGNWEFRGCNSVAGNGIPCGGAVLFYAPLEQGPGTPNAIYYGANKLYRSSDTGLNHTAVSQDLTNPISAIGISPQNDTVRIVGQSNGGIFGTTAGLVTLTNLDAGGAVPNNFVARAVIDPNNVNTAYVTLSAFGVANVWRTTNLSDPAPTWTAVGGAINILPQVPVSAFIVDPTDSNTLYAGTDIGVFVSTDAGANWTPFGTGLPRVAVFDMARTSSGLIRIATHGRGMWQIPALGSTPTPAIIPTTATLVSESCPNGAIDPGETVTVAFGVQNTGGADTVNDVGTLQATGGVLSPGVPQNYGVIAAGGLSVSRNFTFTADPTFACGANITATVGHQDGANNLSSVTYTLPTGTVGSPVMVTYSTGATEFPNGASFEIPIDIPDTGVITDVNAKVRLETESIGYLTLGLDGPDGTTGVKLASRRGFGSSLGDGDNNCSGTLTVFDDSACTAISACPAPVPFDGSFRPESPLSKFNDKTINGTWKLTGQFFAVVGICGHMGSNKQRETAPLVIPTSVGCVQLEITRKPFVCCGPTTPACGFSDDFNDNSRDAMKWTPGVLSTVPPADPAVTVLEQNAQLEIQPLANTNGNHNNGYVSVPFNLNDTTTSVEAVAAPTGGSDTIFAVGNDSNNYYRFLVSGSVLSFQEKSGGLATQTSIAFDPSNHHFWRIRHNPVGDQVIFETSPNGVTNWNNRRTVQRHFSLAAARVELGGGSSRAGAGPGKSIFDNFVLRCNSATPPPPTPTPVCGGFSDDFNDNCTNDGNWSLDVLSTPPPADPAVTVLETNMELEIQPRSGIAGNHYHGYVSALTWNLTNTTTKVEVIRAAANGADTIFAIGMDSNNYYRFVVSGAQLLFQAKVNGVLSQTSIAFAVNNHRFWRIRLNPVGDQVIFETSPNGVTWNDRRTVPRQIPLTAARIELSGGSSHTVAGPGKSIFDNFVLSCN